ncbi:MAG: EH signature domain-containing protein, partial [Parvularcula sp.]|nr:EH signature domain-containing protein [Parvularcula sp.]
MRHLHAAIDRAEALTRTGFPKPPTILPHVHHAFASLVGGVDTAEEQEELVPFLRRCKESDPSRLRRSDLNRVLRGAWCDGEFDNLGLAFVDIALGDRRSSSSRALIDGYLLYFPHERPVIHRLAHACAQLVGAEEGPWRDRAQRYSLFDPDKAPARLGSEMASQNKGAFAEVCFDAGLGASPFATRIGQSAFSAACQNIALMDAEAAKKAQANLLDLLESEERSHDNAAVARALLEPWIGERPPEEHRKRIAGFLVDAIGDPRLNPAKWEGIKARLTEACGPDQARAIIDVLRRWLTEAAMRTFFRAIAKTTNRKDQWRTREQFWLAYLDAGLVADAWPALGPRAKDQIRLVAKAEGERLE